jgi:hypothetical protein
VADTPDDTLPLLDLMVESGMSRDRAEPQLKAGVVTVDGRPVTDSTTPVIPRPAA